MRRLRKSAAGTVVFLAAQAAFGAAPNLPAQVPAQPANIYYGAVPPGGNSNPVLVFVHGLRGIAQDWWTDAGDLPGLGNDMYDLAYDAGYRTAFININADGTPNDAGIAGNAAVLSALFPSIASYYGVPSFYLVTHSKGGVDSQAAMLQPGVADLIRAVFMISPPNRGTELADWAYGSGAVVAGPLGLLTPGVFALRTASMGVFRLATDSELIPAGIPHYTIAATDPSGNPLTAITGGILYALTGGTTNDGLVTMPRTRLPNNYSSELGTVATSHFRSLVGSSTFPRINAQIRTSDHNQEFRRVDPAAGFGDRQNSFAWSAIWFKGKLYVGTGRAFLCLVTATLDAELGTAYYPPISPVDDIACPDKPEDIALQAEIWQFTPESFAWNRVYQSPMDVPIEVQGEGGPETKYVAREAGIRGLTVYEEPGGPALYAGTLSAASAFDQYPPYSDGDQYPPPRILRSADGVSWGPISQSPGTFLGDINILPAGTDTKVRGIRSLVSYDGKLFATVSDFRGIGFIIGSETPWLGDNAWFQASPSADAFPAWTLTTFNGYLYCTTGHSTAVNPGYGVYKTDAQGTPPYTFTPVISDGAGQTPEFRARDAFAVAELDGHLFVGTDRPTELVRINADDSWDLMIGTPRPYPDGPTRPLSGIRSSLSNLFIGHFWRLASFDNNLYMTTWDWSTSLRAGQGLAPFLRSNMGFDSLHSSDGIEWFLDTNDGFQDQYTYGGRSLAVTPFGLFLGTANPYFGLQVWQDPKNLDYNGDGGIDINDLLSLRAALGQAASGPDDQRDIDRDGRITVLDLRKLVTQCTNAGCAAVNPALHLPDPPPHLRAATRTISGNSALLSWDPVPGTIRYHVYRFPQVGLGDLFSFTPTITIPELGVSLTVQEILDGAIAGQCSGTTVIEACALAELPPDELYIQGPATWIGSTTGLTFSDADVPGGLQQIYFVKAEFENGVLSDRSNIVGGPSEAPDTGFAALARAVTKSTETGELAQNLHLARELLDSVLRSSSAFAYGRFDESSDFVLSFLARLEDAEEHALIGRSTANSLEYYASGLYRNLLLVREGLVDPDRLMEDASHETDTWTTSSTDAPTGRTPNG